MRFSFYIVCGRASLILDSVYRVLDVTPEQARGVVRDTLAKHARLRPDTSLFQDDLRLEHLGTR